METCRHTKNFNSKLKIRSKMSIAICILGGRGFINIAKPILEKTYSSVYEISYYFVHEQGYSSMYEKGELMFYTWEKLLLLRGSFSTHFFRIFLARSWGTSSCAPCGMRSSLPVSSAQDRRSTKSPAKRRVAITKQHKN